MSWHAPASVCAQKIIAWKMDTVRVLNWRSTKACERQRAVQLDFGKRARCTSTIPNDNLQLSGRPDLDCPILRMIVRRD